MPKVEKAGVPATAQFRTADQQVNEPSLRLAQAGAAESRSRSAREARAIAMPPHGFQTFDQTVDGVIKRTIAGPVAR